MLAPYIHEQNQCVLQSCFRPKNATLIWDQRGLLLTEVSAQGCDLTRPGMCRSSGFFSMAGVNGKLFAGTYNNGGGYPRGRSNFLQIRSLAAPVWRADWSSGPDPAAKESFYRIKPMGRGVIATSESGMLFGGVFAWVPLQPIGGFWRKIYEWDVSPKNSLRGIGVLGVQAFLSGYSTFNRESSIRLFDRAALEAAAASARPYAGLVRDVPDTGFETIGFVLYQSRLYAFGNGGLRMLLPDGSDFTVVCDTRNAGINFKNAVVWNGRLWIAGTAGGRPALFSYVAGGACREVFEPTPEQVGMDRPDVKLWALAPRGNELFVSTLCFDETELGACDVPLNAASQDRSGIFKCYDDPTTPANGCLAQATWQFVMGLPEYGVKEMFFLGENLLAATNMAKDNRGGAVWKFSCPWRPAPR